MAWVTEGYTAQVVGGGAVGVGSGFRSSLNHISDQAWLSAELVRLQELGVVRVVPHSFVLSLSPVFLVPKKGPKRYRLVVDLRGVNARLPPLTPVKFEAWSTILAMVRPGDWMTSIDLKDAYFHVGVREDLARHLCIRVNRCFYTYDVLPFGLRDSPGVFTKFLRVLIKRWRARGIRVTAFIDDLLFLHQSRQQLGEQMAFVLLDLEQHGLMVSLDKSVLVPVQRMPHLGMIIDTERDQLLLPPEKLDLLRSTAACILQRGRVSRAQLQTLAGRAIFAALSLPLLAASTKQLYAFIRAGRHQGMMAVPVEVRQALLFLLAILDSPCRVTSWTLPSVRPQQILTTDASLTRWAARLQSVDHPASGPFPVALRTWHINAKELTAVLFGLRSFTPQLRGTRVLLQIDNTAAIGILNHMGSTRSAALTETSVAIWKWAWLHDVELHPVWIASAENQADAASRFLDRNDWQLNQAVFARLDEIWGPHTVDRFASVGNRMLARYNSRFPDPEAEAVDAFSCSWRNENNYINPPFVAHIVLRVLEKIRVEHARATVILPVWRSAPWWPVLLELATFVVRLPRWEDLFLPGSAVRPVGPPQWAAAAFRIGGGAPPGSLTWLSPIV